MFNEQVRDLRKTNGDLLKETKKLNDRIERQYTAGQSQNAQNLPNSTRTTKSASNATKTPPSETTAQRWTSG